MMNSNSFTKKKKKKKKKKGRSVLELETKSRTRFLDSIRFEIYTRLLLASIRSVEALEGSLSPLEKKFVRGGGS